MSDAAATTAATDRCPRCGGAFHCGMADAGPCACTSVTLDEPTQAALRERYSGCLCLRCLMELGRPAAASMPTASQR
jgi:hypothetical protein